MNMGLSNSVKPVLMQNQGFFPGTGVYFRDATTNAFDDMDKFSVVVFYEYNSLVQSDHCLFSLWDGDSVKSGFRFFTSSGGIYGVVGNGENAETYSTAVLIDYSIKYGGNANTTQNASKLDCVVFVFDASATNDMTLYHINGGISRVKAKNANYSDTGTIGTNTAISIGNEWDGDTLAKQCNDAFKIIKVSFWKDTALSNANIQSLTNMPGTIADAASNPGYLKDVVGKGGAAGYTAASVTQPDHEWIFDIANTSYTDTGSVGGFDLTATGSRTAGLVGSTNQPS